LSTKNHPENEAKVTDSAVFSTEKWKFNYFESANLLDNFWQLSS